MAAPAIIQCPTCDKKFKGKPELGGKKIKCPGCGNPFTVPDEEEAVFAVAGQPKPASKPELAPAMEEEEENDNPYGVTHIDLSARCPNCANKMESEDAIICLHCGYNTQTRLLGVTKKLVAHNFQERLIWLLPGLGCVFAILLLCIWQLYYCVYFEEATQKSWMNFLNAESMRLWSAMLCLAIIWLLGLFVYKRLIVHPTPPEKDMD